MKKYIRTKDGVYQVRKPALDEYLWEDSTYVYSHEHIDNKDIIKRADTIEKLCDEFVDTSELERNYTMTGGWLYDLYDKEHKCLIWFDEDKKHIMPLSELDDITQVRGAIWKDKGLIYVAKLNENGELELL